MTDAARRDLYSRLWPDDPGPQPVPIPAFTATRGDRTLKCDVVHTEVGLDLRLWERGELLRSRLAKILAMT